MVLKATPIQRKLMAAILSTSGAVLLLTCTAFFAYEFLTFRQSTTRQLSTLGKIIAANSTAALAFDANEDAAEVLSALKAERHITAACLYDDEGKIFSRYPANLPIDFFPETPGQYGYIFEKSHLVGFQPVIQENKQLGTLYLKSDTNAMYDRLRLYGTMMLLIIVVSFLLAYVLSKKLQRKIAQPILDLAKTAEAISDRHDYSVRATKLEDDELGLLTDAFNHMLTQIQEQNKEILSFNQKLELKVVERTNELESANKELESFSYSVSHDLRAPLRAIGGFAHILEREYGKVLDEEGKRLLDVVQSNAKRMGYQIDDLLAFSRLGRKDVQKTNADMKGLAESALMEVGKTVTHAAEVRIGDLHPVQADYSLIGHVFVNLISNAIKYSSKTPNPVVEIKSEEKDNMIIYSIKDNGAGFDMQYANKLFGVFQRLHSMEEFEGTGVGLAIVQRIVSKHGGKVWAEGEVNKGATFYFSLPAIIKNHKQ